MITFLGAEADVEGGDGSGAGVHVSEGIIFEVRHVGAAFTEASALTKIIHAVVKHGKDVGSSFVFFERKNIAVGFPSVALNRQKTRYKRFPIICLGN